MPLAASVAITGRTISSMTARSSAGVTSGDGEYAPMPPVLGPVSPSPRRLWSCDGARHHVLRECLAALERGGGAARTEAAQTGRGEVVGDTEHERQLRADDGRVDALAAREVAERRDVVRGDRDVLGERRRPCIAGR